MDVFHFTLLAATAGVARGTLVTHTSEVLHCNSEFGYANASGIFPFAIDLPSANSSNQSIPDPAWAFTVIAADDKVQQTLWYDTAGQNYSDSGTLGYNVCAFTVNHIPINTIELGQTDLGDCHSTLTPQCREAIRTSFANAARDVGSSPTPETCAQILGAVGQDGQDFPRACAWDFGIAYSTGIYSLTDPTDSWLNNYPCTVGTLGEKYQIVTSVYEDWSWEVYKNYTRTVIPVVTVAYGVASEQNNTVQTDADVTTRCLRAEEWGVDAVSILPLPKGTPYGGRSGGKGSSSGLAGGAIAGIVVGAVAFGVLVAVGWAVWRGRARQRKSVERGS